MTTPDEIWAGIEERIGQEGRVLVLERGPHYLQFLFDDRGGVLTEAVSNEFLAGEARLGPEQCKRLLELAWRPPIATCDDPECCEGTHPNFWRYWPAPIDPGFLVLYAAETLASVYYCDDLDVVECG